MPENIDILMKIVDDHGPVIGESQSTLARGDDFVKGFEPGLFFDIADYDLDVALRGEESSGEADGDGAGQKLGPDGRPLKPKKKKGGGGGFGQWLAASREGYPVDLQPFQFTKQLDNTSPLLFYFCANSVSLKSATMVARKASGQKLASAGGGDQKVVSQGYWGYLRLDFFDVLLTSVNWDVDGAVGKEKVKLICRRLQLQYRAQKPDGSMSEPIGAEWKFNADLASA
jgi:type VI protein secretion system component Hcp